MLCFEISLPVVQRKAYVITAFWRKVVRVGPSPLVTHKADIWLGGRWTSRRLRFRIRPPRYL